MDNETSIDIMVLLSDLIKGIKRLWYLVLVLASVMSWLFFYVSARKYTPLYTSKATLQFLQHMRTITQGTATATTTIVRPHPRWR